MFSKVLIVLLLLALAVAIIFALRRKDQPIVFKVMAVIIASFVLGLPLLIVLYYHSTYSTIDGFVSNIAEAFGWSSKFAVGVTILLVVLTTYISGMIFSLSPGKRRVGASIFAIGLAAYYFIWDAGTRQNMFTAAGGQWKCFTISAESVRFFEKQQVDPRTGEMCRLVDKENLLFIQGIDKKMRSGEAIHQILESEYANLRLFATGTSGGAIPLVWYFKAKDGTIELFDTPGVHPVYGVNLEPINTSIALEWDASIVHSKTKETLSAPAVTPDQSKQVVPQTLPQNDVKIDYKSLQQSINVDATGGNGEITRLTVIIRSIAYTDAKDGELSVDFSVCNYGNHDTYFPITIYYTDKNSHSVYWPSDQTTDFPIGWCQTYRPGIKLDSQLEQIDFKTGTFYVSGWSAFILPIPVHVAG